MGKNLKFNSSHGFYDDGSSVITTFDDPLDVKTFTHLSKRRSQMFVDGYCDFFNYTPVPRKSSSAERGKSLNDPSACLQGKKCRSAITSKSESVKRSREKTVNKHPRRSK